MRWFRGRRALHKQPIPSRDKPLPPSSKTPGYSAPVPKKKGPKLRKPHVKRYFVSQVTDKTAASHIQDVSHSALAMYDMGESGPIVGISWVGSGQPCTGVGSNASSCDGMIGRSWDSLEAFLSERNIAVSPNGKEVGMYGYSHPDCSCSLQVTLSDGSVVDVGPGG